MVKHSWLKWLWNKCHCLLMIINMQIHDYYANSSELLLSATAGDEVNRPRLPVVIADVARALNESHISVYTEVLRLRNMMQRERRETSHTNLGFLMKCSGSVDRVVVAQGVRNMFTIRMSSAQQRLHDYYETMRSIAGQRGSPIELIKQHLIHH